jgi:hypothetical protein
MTINLLVQDDDGNVVLEIEDLHVADFHLTGNKAITREEALLTALARMAGYVVVSGDNSFSVMASRVDPWDRR